MTTPKPKAILIGASAGGIQALQIILRGLPKLFSIPLVVVQHIAPGNGVDWQLVFGHDCALSMREALDKSPLRPGHVYFAPADYHLLIEIDGSLALTQDEPVCFSRPSIDVLFKSAGNVWQNEVCAILLTGASADGSRGLAHLHALGAYTIVQSPAEASHPVMPSSALEIFEPSAVLTLSEITEYLVLLDKGGVNV